MDIIKELFYGNIMPNITHIPEGSEHAKAVRLQEEIEEKLRTLLDKAEHSLFLNHVNAQSRIEGILSEEKFVYGFKVGLLVGVETLHHAECLVDD